MLHRYLRWTFFSILSGLLAGVSAFVFLESLNLATHFRKANPIIVWLLPIGGLLIGLIYHYYGKEVNRGTNLILDEIHDPKKVIPVKMIPMLFFGSVVTHLLGGSAGREGAIVQAGASLSDQLSHFFKIENEERKILLTTGAGAAFGAAIGAPWAGVIFGMEVIHIGKFRLFALVECVVASFVGYYTTIVLGVQHQHYPFVKLSFFDYKTLFYISFAGVVFGLTANLFARFTHLIERVNTKLIPYSPLRPFCVGIILVVLYYLEGSDRYMGLGINYIQESLTIPSSFKEPFLKFFFTALTVGSGFKGGEFVPLVFIGTTLGSALSLVLPVSFNLLAAVGFVALFAGAANTPITCSILAIEVFGFEIAPYAIVACFISYYFSGHHGIYKSQKIDNRKHHNLIGWVQWLKKAKVNH